MSSYPASAWCHRQAQETGDLDVSTSQGPTIVAGERVTYAEIRLGNGDVFTVEGEVGEVEKSLSDAARSGQSRLAWFTEHESGSSVGINPDHVATLRIHDSPD